MGVASFSTLGHKGIRAWGGGKYIFMTAIRQMYRVGEMKMDDDDINMREME